MARSVSVTMTGIPELDAKLEGMRTTVRNRIARNTLGAGARAVQKAIKKEALQKWLKDAVGTRNEKGRSGRLETKVGVNVGKRSRTKARQWAPLIVLGSGQRFRKKIGGKFSYIRNPTHDQLRTGQIKADGIVSRGVAASKGSASSAMKVAFNRSLEREVAKAKLNK